MDLNRLRILAGLNEGLTPQDFEKVMFGDFKHGVEPDTDIERDVYKALERFIGDSTPGNKANANELLVKMMALKKHYPDDLEPNATIAYRGTQMKPMAYRSIAAKYTDAPASSWISLDHTYNPRSAIQSWSTSIDMAVSFAISGGAIHGKTQWMERYPYPAVIEVKVDNDFLFNTKLTNLISKFIHQMAEHEIIRISPNPVKCKLLILSDWLVAGSRA